MKTSTLACMAGVAVPLIVTGSASGGFVGIEVDVDFEALQYGLLTVQVYVIFDRPGEDLMQAVAGTPGNPLILDAFGGTFFQHSLGTNKAPLQAAVNFFPSLAYDSFVTIGVKTTGDDPQGGGINVPDQLTLTPTFPTDISGSKFVLTNDSWAVTPAQAQSNPFDANYAAGDGHVLIGQFSSADAPCVSGTMLLQFVSNGVTEQQVVSFFYDSVKNCFPAPGALPILGVAGVLGCIHRRRRS